MALLGVHGTVSFSREWGQVVAVGNSRLVPGPPNTLDVSDPSIWSGDRVLLVCQRGIPLGLPTPESPCSYEYIENNGYAPCPNGYSFYGGGQYDPGPNGIRRIERDSIYIGLDNFPFYDDLPTTTSMYAYVHRDELDNITFYSDENDAINGGGKSYLPLSILDVGALLVSPAPEGNYPQALLNQLLSFASPLIFDSGEQEVFGDQFLPDSLVKSVAEYLENTSEVSGWKQVANLTSWVFETNVDVLDQSAIGQKFGESAKGALKGAGSLNGIIDSARSSEILTSSSMLRLMFITQVGAKAKAKFIIADGSKSERNCDDKKTIYYEAPIIISASTVNTTVDEVITMTIQYVATGKIRIAVEGSS